MPWVITVKPRGSSSLGSHRDVTTLLRSALPKLDVALHPSTIDRLRALRDSGEDVPIDHWVRARDDDGFWVARTCEGDCHIEFSYANRSRVSQVRVEIGGSGDPGPVLRRLRDTADLRLFEESVPGGTLGRRQAGDPTPGDRVILREIDIEAGTPEGWRCFQTLRKYLLSRE